MSDFETFYEEKILNGDQNRLGRRASCLEAWTHQEAAIKEMDEVIKLQDADLRKYEKQIESLKEQLNNMEACYIEKKRERDELHAVLKCVSEHFVMNDLDGCMPRVFEMIQEALRGVND